MPWAPRECEVPGLVLELVCIAVAERVEAIVERVMVPVNVAAAHAVAVLALECDAMAAEELALAVPVLELERPTFLNRKQG